MNGVVPIPLIHILRGLPDRLGRTHIGLCMRLHIPQP